jgi:hypothetical protein
MLWLKNDKPSSGPTTRIQKRVYVTTVFQVGDQNLHNLKYTQCKRYRMPEMYNLNFIKCYKYIVLCDIGI